MFRGPTHTPPIGVLLDDLPTQDAERIARHLGVSARTLARWQRTGNAPRMAHLALFWESRWGLSAAHCDATNGETVALALARSLERECATLRARIRYLEDTGDFGAANAPLWRAPTWTAPPAPHPHPPPARPTTARPPARQVQPARPVPATHQARTRRP